MAFQRRMPPTFCTLLPIQLGLLFALLALIVPNNAQQHTPCHTNEIFNGEKCVCAAGYFDKSAKDRCDDECDEQYFTYFTNGECVKFPADKAGTQCNMKCGVRLRVWAIVALFAVILAAILTLVLLLPMCVTNCLSCLHAKKASKHSRQVAIETQQSPNKEQQLQAHGTYNPYSYWPYYGR